VRKHSTDSAGQLSFNSKNFLIDGKDLVRRITSYVIW